MNHSTLTQHNALTTHAFWECGCKTNYLHHKRAFVSSCSRCGVSSDEGPDAILDQLTYPNALVFLKSSSLYTKYYELVALYDAKEQDASPQDSCDDATHTSPYLARLHPAKITNGTQIFKNESHPFIIPATSIAGFVYPTTLCGNIFNYILEDKNDE
jgi:hypothetical protein